MAGLCSSEKLFFQDGAGKQPNLVGSQPKRIRMQNSEWGKNISIKAEIFVFLYFR